MRCHNHRLYKFHNSQRTFSDRKSPLRDGILTGYGDGEYSFNRARWEYDLLMGAFRRTGDQSEAWTGLQPDQQGTREEEGSGGI